MLRRLHVRNYVLIDSLDIEFPEGLVIVTGQTGAGKSILLGSVSLVLGAKADVSAIGEGADNCVVEAEFEVSPDDSFLRSALEENDAEWDGGRIILRRVVSRTGRSRAFVNDSPANIQLISSIASRLVDIHSQHQTLMLSDRRFQMSVLDYFAGNSALLSSCREAYSRHTAIKSEIEDLERRLSAAESEQEYNASRLMQLEAAGLRAGELEELESEQKLLANAESVKENLYGAENSLSSSENGGAASVDMSLREAERRLAKVSPVLPEAEALASRIASCRVELDDVLSEISSLNSRTELSRERLESVEERMSLLYGLLKKFSCRTVEELMRVRDSLKECVSGTDALAAGLEELKKEEKKCRAELDAAASALGESRRKAAPALAKTVQESVRGLELPNAVFCVSVEDAPLSASGADSVSFGFSSAGKTPVDLAKCASGGEMSRIMLCLKALLAKYTHMPTLIFDEIDTGVSGSTADKMGSMICSMGRDMQVFAITHLPQVAAKGNAHYLVSKDSEKSVTTIKKIEDGERVLEIARMLSGSEITGTAIANAESLLSCKAD